MQYAISLSPADRDRWNVSGAVSVENSKTPTADAVHALVAIGKAGPTDSVRVQWQGAPIVANVGAVLAYRPGAGRQSVESKPFGFMPNNLHR